MTNIQTGATLGTQGLSSRPRSQSCVCQTEEIVVVMDDRDGRDAVRAIRAGIALMGTSTFIRG